MNVQEAIAGIIKKYQLGVKDVYAHEKGWKLVTSDGIRRIIFIEKIRISKALLFISPDGKTAVISCSAAQHNPDGADPSYMALGEVSPDNNTFAYPINVAEKRAEGRAVLNLIGLYADGFRSELEIDEFVVASKMLERIEAKSTSAIQETVDQLKAPKKGKKSLRLHPSTDPILNQSDESDELSRKLIGDKYDELSEKKGI